MPCRSRIVSLVALAVLAASPAHATFHIMSITEVMVGIGGDPDAQYVELREELAGQHLVTNTRLAAFNADGTTVNVVTLSNHDVANQSLNRRILYATSNFTTLTGLTPDFTIPSGMIFTPSGMVCWGAPSQISVPPPTWDATNPNNYIDCVAYGNYTGPTRGASPTLGSSGTPSALPPGDGTQALTRIAHKGQEAGNNATDFALRPPGPCTNAATSCNVNGCPSGGGQCALLGCGNGNVDSGETCDDGNLVDGDGCDADCTPTPTQQQLGCRKGINKAAAKFGQAYAKANGGCELQVLAGKIMGPCPDTKTGEKITKGDGGADAAIAKACTGVTVAGAGFPANCPGMDTMCGAPLASAADVATCVECAQQRAAFSFTNQIFAGLEAGNAAALKCRTAIGKAYGKLYATNSKALAKCEDGDFADKIPGPCPDTKASDTFSAAVNKAAAALCKACGGADKNCGGGDDVTIADIGITTCPSVKYQGLDCGTLPVTNLGQLAACLQCVTASRTVCADYNTAQPKAVPADCDPVP